MENSELVKDPKKLYWDERNNTVMRYLPISDRFVEYNSLWNVDKGGYNSQYRYNFFTESKEPFFDFYKQQTMRKDNKFLNLHPSNLRRNNSYFPNYLNYTTNSFNRFNGGSNSLYALNNASLGDMGNNQQFGIMRNDYSEDIDTIALAMKYPELGRITQFSASKNIPKDMWPHLGYGTNYLKENEYGERLLGIIPYKGLNYKYDKNLKVPGRTIWADKSIIFPQKDPDLSAQIEELFHHAQLNHYNRDGRSSKDIPAMNLELEAKVGEDIIYAKNKFEAAAEYDEPIIYNDSIDPEYYEGLGGGIVVTAPKTGEKTQEVRFDGNFYNPLGAKILMGRDPNDEYTNKLYNEYPPFIYRVSGSGNFTKNDQEIYNRVGYFLTPEKSNHDSRAFEESISPEVLLYMLGK